MEGGWVRPKSDRLLTELKPTGIFSVTKEARGLCFSGFGDSRVDGVTFWC